jgi:RimJ/RimL family protein N-acetyltransferase
MISRRGSFINTFFDRVSRLIQVHIHRQLTENNLSLRPVRIFDALFIHSGFVSDDFPAAKGLTRPITSSWFLMWCWLKKRFAFSYCILVNGRRAGFIGLHNMRPCAYAEMSLALFEKDMRRKGYGSRAFHLLMHDLEKLQFAEKIFVRVEKDNFISLAFWKKLGFEEVKKKDGVIILLYAACPSRLLHDGPGIQISPTI